MMTGPGLLNGQHHRVLLEKVPETELEVVMGAPAQSLAKLRKYVAESKTTIQVPMHAHTHTCTHAYLRARMAHICTWHGMACMPTHCAPRHATPHRASS